MLTTSHKACSCIWCLTTYHNLIEMWYKNYHTRAATLQAEAKYGTPLWIYMYKCLFSYNVPQHEASGTIWHWLVTWVNRSNADSVLLKDTTYWHHQGLNLHLHLFEGMILYLMTKCWTSTHTHTYTQTHIYIYINTWAKEAMQNMSRMMTIIQTPTVQSGAGHYLTVVTIWLMMSGMVTRGVKRKGYWPLDTTSLCL